MHIFFTFQTLAEILQYTQKVLEFMPFPKILKPQENYNPSDISQIREFFLQLQKLVIPVELKKVKPDATLVDTLKGQLGLDVKDLLTIDWLLQIVPEQIVLVFIGNGKYKCQSSHILLDYPGVEKLFTYIESESW